jgi:DNA-binding NarL/FixJ family response regulator
MNSITIIIADSQNLYRIGLKSIVKKHFKKVKIKEASTKKELFECFNNNEISYLFLDPNNIKSFNVEEIISLNDQFPECKIIVTTCSQHQVSESLLYQNVIKGYICKTNKQQVFEEAITKIEGDEDYFCNEILSKIIKNKVDNSNEINCLLTERETEIVKLIGQGKSGEEISKQLFISVHTFRTHRKNIMKKTKINSLSKLILYAINNFLI